MKIFLRAIWLSGALRADLIQCGELGSRRSCANTTERQCGENANMGQHTYLQSNRWDGRVVQAVWTARASPRSFDDAVPSARSEQER